MRSKVRILTSLILSALCMSSAQVPTNSWRVLLIYTNSMEADWPGHDWYADHVATMRSTADAIYANTGMAVNMHLAGLIKDQTSYPIKDYDTQTSDANNPSGPLARYIALLDEYAADVFVLINEISYGEYGGAT